MGRFIPNENTWIGFTPAEPGGLPKPTGTAATATTGGSLAAATYHYAVQALDAAGHSVSSDDISQVVPAGTATNTVTLTVGAVAGETGGWKVYGRTSGGLGLLGTIAHGATTFVDTGAVTPGATIPTGDTSATLDSPTVAEVNACIDLTDLTMSFNASAQGNAVPTPSFSKLFETSILGTSQATFTADFYRDDEDDLAWNTLQRATKGFFIISRYGGKPAASDICEVWPVTVLSRAMANMANNTVESFTVTCAVPQEPAEDAVVVA
jgi:hypothetical protein